MKHAHLIDFVTAQPWAILPSKLAVITSVLQAHLDGGEYEDLEDARREAAARQVARETQRKPALVGVIPIHGTILPRSIGLEALSGITTTEKIRAQLEDLVANDKVSAIVLDIDSPGGVVQGVPETADAIYAARGSKPIVAQVWDMAASAAYWLATAADEVVVTPSGEVGSIGVWSMHLDYSRALANAGVTPTIIQAGKYKTEMNPYEPLSKEAVEFEQDQVDEIHREFIDAVARNREVRTSIVEQDYGQGRTLRARAAIRLGMADGIGTFTETVARVVPSRSRRGATRALKLQIAAYGLR